MSLQDVDSLLAEVGHDSFRSGWSSSIRAHASRSQYRRSVRGTAVTAFNSRRVEGGA